MVMIHHNACTNAPRGLLILWLLWLPLEVFSQNQSSGVAPVPSGSGVVLRQSLSGPYTLVERSDWARYDNGKYTGHVYREVRYQLRPVQESTDVRYTGTVYVFEETLRDLQKAARFLDTIVPVEFTLSPTGFIKIKLDEGYPSLRNFPLLIDTPLSPGDSWVGQGQRVVDPRNDGNRVSLPIVVEYVFQGEELYKGEKVYRIRAQYATRYKATGQRGLAASETFSEASGKHVVDILLRSSDGRPVLMRDSLDETFLWPDGTAVRYKGFTLSFSEGYLPFDRGAVVAQLARQLGAEPGAAGTGGITSTGTAVQAGGETPQAEGLFQLDEGSSAPTQPPPVVDLPGQNIEIAAVPEGIKLTVRDIRFVADSEQILPTERGRLDLIAQAVKSVLEATSGQTMVLVEGYTASVGKPEGEQELSVRRAKKIVDELAARGIPADRFMYKGWGGTKPIADNSTETGRAKNRRVEITIIQ